MKYDATLKRLIVASQLVRTLTGSPIAEVLPTEFPLAQTRHPDLLLRLDDGRLIHIELQSRNEADMMWRMLDYYGVIWTTLKEIPRQFVLYVGDDPCKMDSRISHPTLNFSCTVMDLRELDAQSLQQSDRIADQLFTLLCHRGAEAENIRRIVSQIARVKGRGQDDAVSQLLLLSGLRRVEDRVAVEAKEMPVYIEDNSYLMGLIQQGEVRGRREGELSALRRLLTHKFGSIPSWAEDRIQTATPEQIAQWELAVLDARDLTGVLGEPPQSA